MQDPDRQFSVPRLAPGHFHRRRPFERLESVADAALIIIHAPRGGGKTNLVSEWVQHRAHDEPCIWVSFGETGSTPDELWARLERAFGEFLGTTAIPRNEIVSEVNRHNTPFTLVIDDAHHSDGQFRDDLLTLIRELHVGRVISLTRVLDTAALSSVRVQVQLAVLTSQDLAFTESEALEFVAEQAKRGGSVPKRAEVAMIIEASGGHPLLLRHLLSTPYSEAEELAQKATHAWAAALLSSDAKGTSLELVLAPKVDAELARRITGVIEPTELLAELARDALGTIDEDGFFHFFPAVRLAVFYRARQDVSAARQEEIHTITTEYLRELEGHESAILPMLAQSGRYEDMWLLFAAKLGGGDAEGVKLTSAAPLSPGLGADHEAETVAGVLQMANDPVPSIGLLRLIDEALGDLRASPTNDDPEAAIYHEVAIQALHWAAGRFAEGAERAPLLQQLTEALGPASSNRAWSAAYWGLLYASSALALTGEFQDAEQILVKAGSDGDEERTQLRLIQRAFIHAMRGEVTAAKALLQSDVAIDSPEWSAKRVIVQAAVALERGHAPEALAALEAVESDIGILREWPFYLIVRARVHTALDPRVGIEDLNRLFGIHGQRPITPRVLDLLNSARADLALAAGEVRQARRIIAGHTHADVAQRLSAARIALVSPSTGVVEDLRDFIDENDVWTRGRAMAFFLLAVHLHRQGERVAAGESLKSAVSITGGHGIRLIVSLVPRSELDEIAAEAGLAFPSNVNGSNPFEGPRAPVTLTPREGLLLGWLATSKKLKDIADEEFVTLHTVKSQASSVYRKLGVTSRAAAVQEGYRLGLIDRPKPS